MGLGKVMGSHAVPPAAGGMDLSILSAIAPPDPEAQRKYEAMGLPDPVAFAALTALGAIPNPMAMLNKMMLAAQERIDRDAAGDGARLAPPAGGASPSSPPGRSREPPLAVPPGKSFVEAFHDLQRAVSQPPGLAVARPVDDIAAAGVRQMEERLGQQAREAAAQAKAAADRAKEAAQTAALNRDADFMRAAQARDATAARDIAHVFSAEDDAEAALPARPLGTTLSSLLTGRQSAPEGLGPAAASASSGGTTARHLRLSGFPRGTAESAIRLECARHGAVSSVIMEPDGASCYVTFAAADMAMIAAARLVERTGLFGAPADASPLVRLVAEIPDSIRLAAALPPAPIEEPADPAELPEHLRPRDERKKKRSKSRKRSRSRRRRSRSRKRRRSRSMVRWLDRSRSNSHTATGQYIRATGCSSTVRWWEKKQQSSSSSSSARERRRRQRDAEVEAERRRPRQVAIKGHWAQFVQNGESYYYNVITAKTTWERPNDFDASFSRRPHEIAADEASRAPRATSCFL